MNLTDERLKELENPSLTQNERILLPCHLASEFIHVGQYELAREALGELWRGIGRRPEVEKMKHQTAAEVLLQCGTLSGWLGGVQHISGSQEKAKDLIFEALRLFKSENQHSKVSEAQYELGMCYFRLGSYDEARITLEKSLDTLKDDDDVTLRAKILIRHSIIEIWTGRYRDALDVLEKAREFFESGGDALKGRWHSQRGLVLRRLATAEQRLDYTDKAIMEYTAAIYHFEQAGHERYCGNNLNNLAFLLYKLSRYSEAHERLERARVIFERLRDTGCLAQVNETRARVYITEQKYREANGVIAGVIQTFEKGNEYGRLTDALTVQGVVWARVGVNEHPAPLNGCCLPEWSFASIVFFGVALRHFIELKVHYQKTFSYKLIYGTQYILLLLIGSVLSLALVELSEKGLNVNPQFLANLQVLFFCLGLFSLLIVIITKEKIITNKYNLPKGLDKES